MFQEIMTVMSNVISIAILIFVTIFLTIAIVIDNHDSKCKKIDNNKDL
jgi:hypothetical protein